LVFLCLLATQALAAGTPAGYVVSVALSGPDAVAKTAVVRGGQELPPKLMMPLFAGDVIFLRDSHSRVAIELGDGKEVSVGGNLQRYDVEGEIPTGDDAWSILSAIGSVLAGDEEVTPDNMVAKGDDKSLAVPLAVHGANFIAKGERKLWLTWTGGEAPFVVTVRQADTTTALLPIATRNVEVPVTSHSGDRFSISIADARGQAATIRFRVRDAEPVAPASVQSAVAGESVEALVMATWLMSQEEGSWVIEALQGLHAQAASNQAAAALLDRVIGGWRP
jgi:hypothetical protein